jgi:hypothetical protein
MALIGDTPSSKQLNEMFDAQHIDATAKAFAEITKNDTEYRFGELSEKLIIPSLPDPNNAKDEWRTAILEYFRNVKGSRRKVAEQLEEIITEALTSTPPKTLTFQWSKKGKRRAEVRELVNPDRYEVIIHGSLPSPH